MPSLVTLAGGDLLASSALPAETAERSDGRRWPKVLEVAGLLLRDSVSSVSLVIDNLDGPPPAARSSSAKVELAPPFCDGSADCCTESISMSVSMLGALGTRLAPPTLYFRFPMVMFVLCSYVSSSDV